MFSPSYRGASQVTGSSLGKGKTGFVVTKINVRKILDTVVWSVLSLRKESG